MQRSGTSSCLCSSIPLEKYTARIKVIVAGLRAILNGELGA